MENLKELLIEVIKTKVDRTKKVSLLFSGGTDSLTCLFSCLELGIKPNLYTFYLEGNISEDVKMSKQISDIYNLELKTVMIKKEQKQLIKDIFLLIHKYGVNNKIRIELLHPFIHLLPHITEDYVITGLSADTLYGTNYHSKMSKIEEFMEIRKTALIFDEIDGYSILKKMTEENGKKLIAPYRDEKIIQYFLRSSWKELNDPIQKGPSIKAFEKYFNAHSIYRKSSSLSLNSGIKNWHEILLHSKLNKFNRTDLDELYQDIFGNRITPNDFLEG